MPGSTDSVISSGNTLGDGADASEDPNDLEVSDQPACASMDDHQAEDMPRTSITVGLPGGDVEDLWLQDTIHLDDIRLAAEFVRMLQDTSCEEPTDGSFGGTGRGLKATNSR